MFTHFSQISIGFARISSDFARIFTKSKVLGVRLHLLHPRLLHQCVCASRLQKFWQRHFLLFFQLIAMSKNVFFYCQLNSLLIYKQLKATVRIFFEFQVNCSFVHFVPPISYVSVVALVACSINKTDFRNESARNHQLNTDEFQVYQKSFFCDKCTQVEDTLTPETQWCNSERMLHQLRPRCRSERVVRSRTHMS